LIGYVGVFLSAGVKVMVLVDPNLLNDLRLRGLVSQIAGQELEDYLVEPRTLYCGFDPTADSLHIGSLVPLLTLKRFQMAGHKPIVLVGGATGLIGDPSFKSEERKLNTPEIVSVWVDKLRRQVSRFVTFDAVANRAETVNNLDWIAGLNVLDFLRDVGKHFSVNAMIHKESVKQRLEREGAGISFTEFTYMLLQSYDFAELNKRYDCTLQIGGSDQWGNITGGIDLTRRLNHRHVYGLTLPLVTKADGSKFGKTEAGTVWLDAQKTSVYAFYQFWINTADADVYKFLNYFTFLSVSHIKQIESDDAAVQGRKSAQAILAAEVTRLVHGEAGLESAQRISQALFSDDYTTLDREDFEQLAMDGIPSLCVESRDKTIVDVLVESTLARGNKQAREFISNSAVSVHGELYKPTHERDRPLREFDPAHGKYLIIRRGKKNFCLLILDGG
jgi:tyrosyl-tRNA synthetase